MQATNRDDFSIRKKKPLIFIYVRADLKSDRIEHQHLQCEKRQEVRASNCRNPTEQIFFSKQHFFVISSLLPLTSCHSEY